MPAAVSLQYKYQLQSALLSEERANSRLRLATSGGAVQHPLFFDGLLKNPKQTADHLLALSEISRTRFFSQTELKARLLAAADPVVTCDGEWLRFEVFSVCCGAYARLDLKSKALEGDWLSRGTTNVDFNPPMRAALAGVSNSERLKLKVGIDSVELERESETVLERKVRLPVRWLKGFVEVQSYQTELEFRFETSPIEMERIIKTLPPQSIVQAGAVTYVVAQGSSLRLSQRAAPGAVGIGAISRLRLLLPLLRHAKSVRLYGCDEFVSAVELVSNEANFFFVLSPNAARGFSGEGQALLSLASSSDAQSKLAEVRAALAWQRVLEPNDLGTSLHTDSNTVRTVLQILGTRGLVGYDLASAAFFHRELPFDLDLVESLHPRMEKARALFDEGAVRLSTRTDGGREVFVRGKEGDHFVFVSEESDRCTCDWYAKNQGTRGPCSHILAAELALQSEGEN